MLEDSTGYYLTLNFLFGQAGINNKMKNLDYSWEKYWWVEELTRLMAETCALRARK